MIIETNTYRPEVGDTVTFKGWTKEQVRWGGNSTPYMLIVGRNYVITKVERRAMHTKVCVRGVDESMKFNSVHFTLAEGSVTL